MATEHFRHRPVFRIGKSTPSIRIISRFVLSYTVMCVHSCVPTSTALFDRNQRLIDLMISQMDQSGARPICHVISIKQFGIVVTLMISAPDVHRLI